MVLYESKRQPNKLWVDQGRAFYNSPMEKWLDDNDILMYSTHNEGKSVVAERFFKRNCSREIFVINSVLKTNSWTYKIKDSNGKKKRIFFYEKELLLSKL